MRLQRSKWAGIPVLVLSVLVTSYSRPLPAMVGGQPDFTHLNVGAVVTFHPFLPGNPLAPFCTATLIGASVAVTAGHCAFLLVESGLPAWVSFDQQFDASSSPLIAATPIAHPNFTPSRNPNDVSGVGGDPFELGVLLLAEPVTDLSPALLPAAGLLDDLKRARLLPAGSLFTLVGYGATGFDGGFPVFDGQRRAAEVPFSALLDEAAQFSAPHHAPSACLGDSGGPNFLNVGGVHVLTSVTWWLGTTQCSAWHRAYRLDTPQARSFLVNFVNLP